MEVKLPKHFVDLIQTDDISCLREQYNTLERLSKVSGVYCFWWLDKNKLPPIDITTIFQGPLASKKKYEANTNEYLEVSNKSGGLSYYKKYEDNLMNDSINRIIETEYFPLYVGKTTDLKQRIKDHIMPKIINREAYFKKIKTFDREIYKEDRSTEVIAKRNTKCQFRAGMEYIFKDKKSNKAYQNMFLNVGVSYVAIPQKQFKHRFYVEDLAIGLLKPPFNLDSER